jgi:hypothetical protein
LESVANDWRLVGVVGEVLVAPMQRTLVLPLSKLHKDAAIGIVVAVVVFATGRGVAVTAGAGPFVLLAGLQVGLVERTRVHKSGGQLRFLFGVLVVAVVGIAVAAGTGTGIFVPSTVAIAVVVHVADRGILIHWGGLLRVEGGGSRYDHVGVGFGGRTLNPQFGV